MLFTEGLFRVPALQGMRSDRGSVVAVTVEARAASYRLPLQEGLLYAV
jgi:hypothetical protein